MARIIKVKKAKRYVAVRMPVEAYNNFVRRQQKIEKSVQRITNKIVKVPLTKVFMVSSQNEITLPDTHVLGLTKRKKRR